MAEVGGTGGAGLRIGELSRRTGVKADLLRAWERRYRLLRPERSGGGFRLYSAEDEQRVRTMRRLMSGGLSAAEAATAALREPPAEGEPLPSLAVLAGELSGAIDRFDEEAAQAAIDRLLASFTVETVLRAAILPYLHELGLRWERGAASVAVEHFATAVIRGRLLALGRGWSRGTGPAALLACPSGELHDLGLIAFGIALRQLGWRIVYLGQDTPVPELRAAVEETDVAVIVLAAAKADVFAGMEGEIAALAATRPVYLAGAAATPDLGAALGARVLGTDPVSAAQTVAASERP